MEASSRTKTKLGLLLGGVAAVFFFVLFQLARHPETALLFTTLPGPAALSCTLRCVGVGPFLQVLGEGAKALLLVSLSGLLLYGLIRTALRIFRTWSFMERAERRAVSAQGVPRPSFLDRVTVFEDRSPSAFTAGFIKPKIYVSTGLVDALDENELRAVVLHESHHRESRDPLKGLFVSFVSDLLFFLPVSRWLKKAYHLAAEVTADAGSIDRRADPLDLAASLLKVQKLGGSAAAWFFDPTAERAKHLLGERSRIPWPVKKISLAVVVLAISVSIALIPVRKSITSMFINHEETCALNAGHR